MGTPVISSTTRRGRGTLGGRPRPRFSATIRPSINISPPQMPYGSWRTSARSRQATRAGQVEQIARARAICSTCTVRTMCLARALERREPYGVWGGELVLEGVVVPDKRGRGRPPKVPRPRLVVDEITGIPIVA